MCTVYALGKFKIRVCQGVSGSTKNHFEPFLPIFAYFLSFSSVFYIGIKLYLVYNQLSILVHLCTVIALKKSTSVSVKGYQGVQKHQFEPFFAYFLRFFVFFFSFPHWNHVLFGLQLVQSIRVYMCTVVALGKFKIRVCHGGIRGYKNTIFPIFA